VRILGRVFFTAKANPSKTGLAANWSEIEARLQEISAPTRASDLPVEPALPVAPSSTLANDPAFFDESPVTTDRPVSIPSDPLEMLASPSEASVSLLPHQTIPTEFQEAIPVSTSLNRLAH